MIKQLVFFTLSFVLVACQSTSNNSPLDTNQPIDSESPPPSTNLEPASILEESTTEILVPAKTLAAAPIDPIIIRLLEQGNKALKRNDLLTPKDDNANMYFQAVLGRDPNNKKAQQGLREIIARYTTWAISKTKKRQYKTAQKYMDSAEFVNPQEPQLNAAKKRIKELRKKKKKKKPKKIGLYGNKYYLPSNLLKSNDEVVLQHLQPIIERVKQDKNNIVIYWPNDKEARYLYQIINSRIDSFRVRGMIHLRTDRVIEVKPN